MSHHPFGNLQGHYKEEIGIRYRDKRIREVGNGLPSFFKAERNEGS